MCDQKNCEHCHSFKEHPKRVLLSDGICFLVPSKPQFVKKTNKCGHWTQRKEDK